MEDSLGLAMLALAALVVAIVALAKFAGLKASVDGLKKRIGELERGGATPVLAPGPAKASIPPPLPTYVTERKRAAPATATQPTVPIQPHHPFNWESILGVKLFAWIGGFALFLGVVFFVK